MEEEKKATEIEETSTSPTDSTEQEAKEVENLPVESSEQVEETTEESVPEELPNEIETVTPVVETKEEEVAPTLETPEGEETVAEEKENNQEPAEPLEEVVKNEASAEVKEEVTTEGEEDSESEDQENPYEDIHVDKAGSKKDLLDILKAIHKEDRIRLIDGIFKELRPAYDHFYQPEREKAREEFMSVEGNAEMDFDYHGDATDQEFFQLHDELRSRRGQYFHQLEKEKEANLERKTTILDELRVLIDGEDQTSFNKVKELQDEWKKIGPVPGAQNKTLWANYHALMDRYYDQRSIYFELKDLDRKKNLTQKLELCVRAENLDAKGDLKTAIVQLNELHEEFKHIGPVPREEQEPLWQRFKAASDVVYSHRKEFNEKLKGEFQENLGKKEALIGKLEEFKTFDSDRIKQWNAKTKEILDIQKQWEAIGSVPREKAKAINKQFWGSFKQFFGNKNQFFKKLDSQREENLEKKKQLVAQAAELRESEDWNKTANELKKLQNEWREIGPVPEKVRKTIYEEFKGHCDHFFQKKREQTGEQNKEFDENLKKKLSILDQLDAAADADPMVLDDLYNLLDDYAEVGLVPRGAVSKTHDRYDRIAEKVLTHEALTDSERNELRMQFEVSKLRNSPHGDRKLNRKENAIKRKISGLENDLYNWKRNMEFFGRSNKANELKEQMETRIQEAEVELGKLKEQLKLMRG